MIRCFGIAVVLALCCAPLSNAWAQEKSEKGEKAVKSQEQVITESLQAMASAFNKRDAAAVAAHWSKTGVHTDNETGRTTEGREAIQKLYAETLAGDTAPKLALSIDKVRFITPEVATVDGYAAVTGADDETSHSSFTAVVVKQDKQWLLDSAHETNLPPALKPADFLSPLEWMVGEWVDEAEGVTIKTTVRWSAKKAFLIRSYSVTREDKIAHEGTQIFGWDPREEGIRTWVFGSDGGFAEGRVQIDDTRVSIKLVGVTAEGQEASGTQVITVIDDNTFMSQMVGRELDGEPQPTFDAVKVVRVTTEETPAEISSESQADKPKAEGDKPSEEKQAGKPGKEKTKKSPQESKDDAK